MNTTRITFALAAIAALAVAATVVANRFAVGVDGFIGFGAVIALIAVAATDYRVAFRREIAGR